MVGDVDPCRDLSIISDELRIKDMEFVEKHLEQLKKITGRGGQSLEVKAKKEEEAIVQKVLKHLQDEKDVRKGDWTNKEVPPLPFKRHAFVRVCFRDDKEPQAL
jgi:obg-like ATPase 1